MGTEATGIKDCETCYAKNGIADINEQDGRADCSCDQTTDDDDMRTGTVGQASGPSGHEQLQDPSEAIESNLRRIQTVVGLESAIERPSQTRLKAETQSMPVADASRSAGEMRSN